jgi:hypothetical protein|nr:MAG TPA: hypothetical protein [Caudoviricetes sp.]
MSKRFGRNQKRKMRESLAAQEKQLNNLQRDLDNSRNQNKMERECLEMTRELLGEYFPTIMPKTRDVNHLPLEVLSSSGNVYNLTATVHALHGIEYSYEVDKLREMMYIRVYTPNGGSVAYNWQFRKLPSHIMERILERDLIPMLVNEIKRGM